MGERERARERGSRVDSKNDGAALCERANARLISIGSEASLRSEDSEIERARRAKEGGGETRRGAPRSLPPHSSIAIDIGRVKRLSHTLRLGI